MFLQRLLDHLHLFNSLLLQRRYSREAEIIVRKTTSAWWTRCRTLGWLCSRACQHWAQACPTLLFATTRQTDQSLQWKYLFTIHTHKNIVWSKLHNFESKSKKTLSPGVTILTAPAKKHLIEQHCSSMTYTVLKKSTGCPQKSKPTSFSSYLHQMLNGFQNSFTNTLSNIFTTKSH